MARVASVAQSVASVGSVAGIDSVGLTVATVANVVVVVHCTRKKKQKIFGVSIERNAQMVYVSVNSNKTTLKLH